MRLNVALPTNNILEVTFLRNKFNKNLIAQIPDLEAHRADDSYHKLEVS